MYPIITCDNVLYTDHKHDMCVLYNNVIQCVIDTENDNILTASHIHKTRVPGLTECRVVYKQISLNWYICWNDEGHPYQGKTSRMSRVTRAQYTKDKMAVQWP